MADKKKDEECCNNFDDDESLLLFVFLKILNSMPACMVISVAIASLAAFEIAKLFA